MTLQTKLIILGFLILATTLEVTGDALVRLALGRSALAVKAAYFAVAATLLFGYGLCLNLAPIEFHRVAGIYIATLFIVWQIVSFLVFRSMPTMPVLLGGALIVGGGLMVALWGGDTPPSKLAVVGGPCARKADTDPA